MTDDTSSRRRGHPARLYTWAAGGLLLVQGTSTLAFQLAPALDEAFPLLLAATRMTPQHSILHIVSGIVALALLLRGGERGPLWFAGVFGGFYVALAFVGMVFGHPTALGMQPFDHPFHLVLGGLGVVAWRLELHRTRTREESAT